MLHLSLRRTLHTTGALISIGAVAIACAATASAKPVQNTTSSAQSASLSLLGQTVASKTYTATSVNGVSQTSATASENVPTPSVLSAGVFASTAVARPNVSFSCSGIVAPGGKLSIGGDGQHCGAVGAGARGVQLDLGQLTNLLPFGTGSVVLKFNAITASAAYYASTGFSGTGRITNVRLYVCSAYAVLGACDDKEVVLTPVLTGAPNEDVLAAVLTSLTQSKALGTLGKTIATALKPLVSLTSNVQTQTATTLSVTGLQVKVLGGLLGSANLATATAGKA